MTITLTVEIGNTQIKNFRELVKEAYRIALGIGRQLVATALEHLDEELMTKYC